MVLRGDDMPNSLSTINTGIWFSSRRDGHNEDVSDGDCNNNVKTTHQAFLIHMPLTWAQMSTRPSYGCGCSIGQL